MVDRGGSKNERELRTGRGGEGGSETRSETVRVREERCYFGNAGYGQLMTL